MASHWLSKDGQRTIEIIGPIILQDDVRLGKFHIDCPCRAQRCIHDAWYDDGAIRASTVPYILDHHAEKWLHEQDTTVGFDCGVGVWQFTKWPDPDNNYSKETYPSKSQCLIAAVLAAEEAT